MTVNRVFAIALLAMAAVLAVFKANAAIQSAVTAPVQSSGAATLLLDPKGDVISKNDAFDALWTSLSAQLSGLAQPRLAQAPGPTTGADLNFHPLMRQVELDRRRGGRRLYAKPTDRRH